MHRYSVKILYIWVVFAFASTPSASLSLEELSLEITQLKQNDAAKDVRLQELEFKVQQLETNNRPGKKKQRIQPVSYDQPVVQGTEQSNETVPYATYGQVGLGFSSLPTSCFDLFYIGHELSGIYSIMGSEYLETVYCDFEKLPFDKGFQTRIGYSDVKSSPVYFYAQKYVPHSTVGRIPFELMKLNKGGAMDVNSGIFTAPKSGIYSFHFSGLVCYPASSQNVDISLFLYLNGNFVGCSDTNIGLKGVGGFYTHTLHSTLELKKGDQVWLEIPNSYAKALESGGKLYDSRSHHTHFTGHLLQENMAESFSQINQFHNYIKH